MEERGNITDEQVKDAIENGVSQTTKDEREEFEFSVPYNNVHNGTFYPNVLLKVIVKKEDDTYIVITVIPKFY
ncbi:MAG: DUF4258 domain-containing protein [Ignavibacteriae bacterium]|nr:DUF4258 domain-containing protein [Ignavibacteriota bacterium]MCB9244097.1 DUF4258 domain-containing protein [Ignavibacteriales bacterium]